MASKKMSFEESLARLDEIVRHLEKGDLPLSESQTLFEEGTKQNRKLSSFAKAPIANQSNCRSRRIGYDSRRL